MAKSKRDRENGEWFLGFIWWAIFSSFYFSVVVFVSAPLLLEFIFCLRFASETKSSMFPSAIERRHREEILYISADIWLHCGCARVRFAVASGLAHRCFRFFLTLYFCCGERKLSSSSFRCAQTISCFTFALWFRCIWYENVRWLHAHCAAVHGTY